MAKKNNLELVNGLVAVKGTNRPIFYGFKESDARDISHQLEAFMGNGATIFLKPSEEDLLHEAIRILDQVNKRVRFGFERIIAAADDEIEATDFGNSKEA